MAEATPYVTCYLKVRATDLRTPLLGLAAWAGSLLTGAPWVVALLVLVPLVLAGLGRPQAAWTAVGTVVVCSAVLGVALARAQAVRDGPVAGRPGPARWRR